MILIGINKPIKMIVDTFNAELWPNVPNKSFYGLCYRNQRNNNVIPEVYVERRDEYKEVLFDDKLNVISFFDAEGSISNVNDEPNRTVRLIFAANLRALYPNKSHRATEEAHFDVLKILKSKYRHWAQPISIESGLNAYGGLFTDNVRKFTMHPYYTFAVILNIRYSYNCQI